MHDFRASLIRCLGNGRDSYVLWLDVVIKQAFDVHGREVRPMDEMFW